MVSIFPYASLGRVGKAGHGHEGLEPSFYYVKERVFIMQDVITIIQTVGFPIACAVAMFLMLQNEQKAHREESEKLSTTITELKIDFSEAIHDQESNITEAINNNTLVIQKLLDKLEKD